MTAKKNKKKEWQMVILESNMGGVPCKICPTCFAIVHAIQCDTHEEWHRELNKVARQALDSYAATGRW